MAEGATVTAQPTKKVTVEVPNIDIDHLIQGNWQVKMTDCLTDPVVCVLGCCCPCLLMWQSAEKLGENPLLYCLGGFFCPMMVPLRFKTRERFGIQSDIVSDTILSGYCFCGAFSTCQVANELKKRGL